MDNFFPFPKCFWSAVSVAISLSRRVPVNFLMTSCSWERCCRGPVLMKRSSIIIIPLRHRLIAVIMLRLGERRVLLHAERRHVSLASSVALWFSVVFSSKTPLGPPSHPHPPPYGHWAVRLSPKHASTISHFFLLLPLWFLPSEHCVIIKVSIKWKSYTCAGLLLRPLVPGKLSVQTIAPFPT